MSDEQRRADELVSAYLDGEATPAEIAEVEQDDALSARVDQLRAVRDAAAAPVTPMPAESRDRMIEVALAEADAVGAQQREARIVPIHRRHPTLLAVAAAAVLIAAAVSAGLIAGRGGDDLQTAAEAPAETADAAPAATEMAEAETAPDADMAAAETAPDADMAAAETAPDADMAAAEMAESAEEESMAAPTARLETAEAAADAAPTTAYPELGEAPAAEEARVPEADEAAESEAAQAAAETAEAATEAADDLAEPEAAVREDRADADTADGAESGDGAAGQVVDLGTFESLESLLDDIAARWPAAVEDGAMADPGACSAAVRDAALELDAEAGQPFIAAVGADDPLTYDARFVRRADGAAAVVYAAPPDCETGTREQDESDGS